MKKKKLLHFKGKCKDNRIQYFDPQNEINITINPHKLTINMIRSNVSKYSFVYTSEYKTGTHSTMLDSHLLKKYL